MPPTGFLNPNSVLEEWDIRPGEKIADFGCGPGFFSIPMGQKVGPNGKIYALDIRPEALEATRSKAKLYQLFNVEPTRADLEMERGSGIKDRSVDKVIISNILFQVENREAVIVEISRILRGGGSVLAIEWNDNDPSHPIPASKIDKESLKSLFLAQDFSFQKEFPAGAHHYGILFVKKD